MLGPALVYHAKPLGVYQPVGLVMMHECSPGESLAKTSYMHYDDQEHSTLHPYAVPNRLIL